MASRNAQDGISLIQTAEGALNGRRYQGFSNRLALVIVVSRVLCELISIHKSEQRP